MDNRFLAELYKMAQAIAKKPKPQPKPQPQPAFDPEREKSFPTEPWKS